MCASSRRPWLTGNAPTGTMTGTNRWSLSPTRKRFPSNRPTDFRRHKAASPVRSAVGRIRHKCANHGFRWHPPESTAGSVRESPYDKASRVAPTGKPQCRAGFPGRSVGRTPWPDTARHKEMFARRSRHRNARRAAKMCSKAGNPSAARIPSFRSTWASPSPEKGPGNRRQLQVDTTPKSPKSHSVSNASLAVRSRSTGQ